MRIAVVGFGYWGSKIARVFRDTGCHVLAADTDENRQRAAARQGFHATGKLDLTGAHVDVEAVAVCTPPATHHQIAWDAVCRGVHVLVAKPLTTSSETAAALTREAKQRGVSLLTDHTFVYSPAVERLRIEVNACTPSYYDSVRTNLGTTATGVDVIWDLACHDVSIMLHVLGRSPVRVSAINNNDTQAYVAYRFADGLLAHSHVNWRAPAKIRQTIIGCDDRMIVYDDVSASEKIRVYHADTGMDALADYRLGDIVIPPVSTREPLSVMAEAFLHGCGERTVDETGVSVVSVLEAASRSARANGEWAWVT
ncbi:MAG: Gfo/Idh/MocA family oxidoreductase [Candidatus Krumholzibacteria bacterium]|nr:Gfo/Idh/MocA family oxidoreductase [Candidatus Krumholzibacteria bacterium]